MIARLEFVDRAIMEMIALSAKFPGYFLGRVAAAITTEISVAAGAPLSFFFRFQFLFCFLTRIEN